MIIIALIINGITLLVNIVNVVLIVKIRKSQEALNDRLVRMEGKWR